MTRNEEREREREEGKREASKCNLYYSTRTNDYKVVTKSVIVKNRGIDDSMQRIRYGMTVRVCMYVCERERDRDTRCMTQRNRIRKLMYFTKEKDSTTYKVGGGCFI